MADNKTFQSATPATLPANTVAATKEVSFSGNTADVQLIEVVAVTGSEGSRTLNEISDASGLKIQDGGNTITVDGTVSVTGVATAANQSTANTALAAIQTAVEALDNTVGGNELQVDIVSAPTLTVNAHAVTNAGTFVVQENGTALTHLATIAGDTTDIETAVELIDDTVATLGTTTYSEATTKGLIVGAVRRDADTTLADTTNEIAPLQVDANGRLKVEAFSGETLPVSLTSTTVTGTVAVTQSGTWDEVGINDSGNSITVDNNGTFVTQIDGTALTRFTDIETNTDSGAVVGNGAAATAQRVTLANDSTGIVAATQSGTWNVTNVSGTVSLPTGASTLAEQQTQTTHLATIAGDTTDIEAAVELIDDTIFADDAAYTAATSKLMVVGGQYQSSPNTLDDNDAGSILLDANHAVQAVLRAGTAAIGKLASNDGVDIGDVTLTAGTAEIGSLLPPDTDVTAHTNYAKKYYTSAGAATDGIVWSPAAGKRYHVVSMFINTSAAATVTFEDDKAGGDEAIMKMELAANSGFTINFGEQYPLASGEDAADLLVTTTAGNIYITCTGYEI